MKKIRLSVLNETVCEEFLLDLYHCSKNSLKESFQKEFLKKNLFAKSEITLPVDFANQKKISPSYQAEESPHVLFEDDHFFVVHKPPGIHSTPLRYSDEDCMHAWLRANNFFKILSVNPSEYNRGLLNRLDYETSGILIFAKAEILYHEIRKSFAETFRHKYYLAVVEGQTPQRAELKNHLYSSGKKGSKILVGQGEINAELSYETLASHNSQSLLMVKLITGYRHQIRVQLAEIGFPILGDSLYGNAGKRLYLHAYEYSLFSKDKEYIFKDTKCDDFKKLFPNFLDLNG